MTFSPDIKLSTVILAAGKGTRMRSDLPKVLHRLAERPLLEHVVDTARSISHDDIHVVVGHGSELVKEQLAHKDGIDWIEQIEQLGTGHAVQQAMSDINAKNTVLVLYGDVPLIRQDTLSKLLEITDDNTLALLTVELEDPSGYGRIVRNKDGKVVRIVEHKDANKDELKIGEINTGILAVKASYLRKWLDKLDNNNVQGEYYLTDIISMAAEDGLQIATSSPESEIEIMGVNDKQQLSVLERELQRRQAERLMKEGVTLIDPNRFDLRGEVVVGSDVVIDINVILEGKIELGNRVHIGPNTIIKNAQIGDDVVIQANCVIEDAIVGEQSKIGPFARIRPDTELAASVHIGNFVEIKKSEIGEGSKVNHLSYIGDTTIGSKVNIGAGTITCNYDGANKHRTIIEDNVFIGSDTQLVAPVTIEKGATIGAGSTITHKAPEDELTLSRSKQLTRKGWKRPIKKQ